MCGEVPHLLFTSLERRVVRKSTGYHTCPILARIDNHLSNPLFPSRPVPHPDPRGPRRTTVVYERSRYPLVMADWKHVVMDEVNTGHKALLSVALMRTDFSEFAMDFSWPHVPLFNLPL